MSDIKSKLDALIKDEIRKGKVSKTSNLLSSITDLFSPVEVDVGSIQSKITNNRNPLNAIFRLFGLQLVSNDYVEVTGSGNKVIRKLVTFENSMMKDAIALYASKLEAFENEVQTHDTELTSEINRLNIENDSLRKELSLMRSSYRTQKEGFAVSIQDCISRLDKSTQKEQVETMEDLLEEIGYKAIWAPHGPDDKRFHFHTVNLLKRECELVPVDGLESVFVSKPFLASDDEEPIKGFAYILNPTEEENL